MMPSGDVMGVVMDGRDARGRCPYCGREAQPNGCPECLPRPEFFMAGDPESHDLLSDYGYPFDRFDDEEE